jgi:hypothetical protein
VILEAMKERSTGGAMYKREIYGEITTLHNVMQGTETVISPIVQLKILAEKKEELHRQELAIYKA